MVSMGSEMLNEKRYSVADLAPAPKRKFIYEERRRALRQGVNSNSKLETRNSELRAPVKAKP